MTIRKIELQKGAILMGIYLNPGSRKFQISLNSEIYVDKTGLLTHTNRAFDTEQRHMCVSRPRRFGKSMAANMISAYYDHTVDGAKLFHGLAIASDAHFDEYRNKCNVLFINMQDFLSKSSCATELLQRLQKALLWDLQEEYPDIRYFDPTDLERTMEDVYRHTQRPFVVIIDEWDCLFREYRNRKDWQETYLDFLRTWLKDKAYIGLAYMTGILPIKKYGTHSALNMFYEFSMTGAGPLAPFVGFTESEVQALCERFQMSFEECKTWYDGYQLEEVSSVYNPRSVVQSMQFRKFAPYWNQTETFEALKIYIDMNFEGLRDAVISLMTKEKKHINTRKFSNDMTTFKTMDDVLTLLVHLGYLGYDLSNNTVFIPNQEILLEYVNAIEAGGWEEIARTVKHSEELLQATLAKDTDAVAKGIEEAHLETSHLTYNNETALAYTLSLAYYTARQKYIVLRELPSGKGFADLVFLPRPQHASLPALIIELKWNRSAETALQQIKAKTYPKALESYTGTILLVGINYDKKTRMHECVMEEIHT